MSTLIIGFGYRARSGKDTAVKAILEGRNGLDVRRYGFADALKAEVAGRELELCQKYGIKYEPENKHRTLLQWYGTEYRRAQDPNYWIERMAERIQEEEPDVALISDMRFVDEAEFVKESGGFTVNVIRTGFTDPNTNSAHKSESALDGYPFDFELRAESGDVAGLQAAALRLFDGLVRRAA